MFGKMAPQDYENTCNKIGNFVINSIIVVFLTFILSGVMSAILHWGFSFPIPIKWYYAVLPAFVLAFLIVGTFLIFKKLNLLKYPFIYWWVILFGHPVPLSKLVKRFPNNKYHYDDYKMSIKNTLNQAFGKNNLGLYYILFKETDVNHVPRNKILSDTSAVYFVKKSSAMSVLLMVPEGGYSVD